MMGLRLPVSKILPNIIIGIVFLKLLVFNLLLHSGPMESKAQFLTLPAVCLILFGSSLLLYGVGRIKYLISVNVALSLLLLFDFVYISAFKYPPSIYVFFLSVNLDGLGPAILEMIKPYFWVFFTDVALIAYFMLRKKRKWFYFYPRKIAGTALLGAGLLLFSVKPIKDYFYRGIFPTKAFDPVMSLADYTPPIYHLFDAIYSLSQANRTLRAEDREHIKRWIEWKNVYCEQLPSKLDSSGKGKNLILVQVESLPSDVLFKKVNGAELTPNLNELARKSQYFENIYAQNKGGSSSDAEYLSLTSGYPPLQGSVFFRYPRQTYHTLPKLLKRRGYRTYAFHGNNGAYWNRAEAYPYLGIEEFKSVEVLGAGETIGLGISDIDLFKQASAILASGQKPFFALLVTLSSHSPFKIPEKFWSLTLLNTNDTAVADYFRSLHYADTAIGLFLSRLRADGLLDKSVIAVYGDHDILGGPERRSRYYDGPIGASTREDRVPLIIYVPGAVPKNHQVIGGQVDIAATVASIMGVSTAEYRTKIMGRDLLATGRDFAVIPKTGKCVIGAKAKMKKSDVEMAVAGLEIADLMLKGDYFALQ